VGGEGCFRRVVGIRGIRDDRGNWEARVEAMGVKTTKTLENIMD
jgi:hypothetical protein